MRRLAHALVAIALLASVPARADQAKDKSRVAFKAGARALEEGRPKDALALFKEAYRLYPNDATFYNIGLCERALGHPVEASAAFRSYLRSGTGSEAATVRTLLAESDAKIATVNVTVTPSSAELTLDGTKLDATSAKIDPGDHVVEATAKGYTAGKRSFTADAGATVRVTIALAVPSKSETPQPVASGPRLDGLFWGVAGASLVSLVAGSVMGGIAFSDWKAYRDPAVSPEDKASHKSRGEVLKVTADLAFGAALIGAGASVLLATLRSPAATTVGLVPTRGGAFASISRSF